MTRWYRAYEGTVTDAKLGEVALVAGCSRSVAIAAWHCILESCAALNQGGHFDATPRRVAVILGEPPAVIEAVFAELQSLGMIDGQQVCAWQRRQFESDSSTERSRKHREAKRNADATLQQRDATPPYTEAETDISSLRSDIARKPREPNGSRLPEGWTPSVGQPENLVELEKFRDYWSAMAGAKARKRDWDAAWRNWLRNAAEWKKTTPRAGPPANPIITELAAHLRASHAKPDDFQGVTIDARPFRADHAGPEPSDDAGSQFGGEWQDSRLRSLVATAARRA